jgi:hypothetical protein
MSNIICFRTSPAMRVPRERMGAGLVRQSLCPLCVSAANGEGFSSLGLNHLFTKSRVISNGLAQNPLAPVRVMWDQSARSTAAAEGMMHRKFIHGRDQLQLMRCNFNLAMSF